MKKYLIKLLILQYIMIVLTLDLSSNWEEKYTSIYVTSITEQNDKLFFGRRNGVTVHNKDYTFIERFTSLNSDLPHNLIISSLVLEDGAVILSTPKGICALQNSVISMNHNVVKNFKDKESGILYLDNQMRIWTFTSTEVLTFSNDKWTKIDIKEKIPYSYKIQKLNVLDDQVWVQYSTDQQNKMGLAIINANTNAVVKTFSNEYQFPQTTSPIYLEQLGDDILYKSKDWLYIYRNNDWIKLSNFADSFEQVNNNSGIVKDKEDNIFYCVYNGLTSNSYPVSMNLTTKVKTKYFENEDVVEIYSLFKSQDKLYAYDFNFIYIYENKVWTKISTTEFNLDKSSYYDFLEFNNEIFLRESKFVNRKWELKYININTKKEIPTLNQSLSSEMIQSINVNKNSQNLYKDYKNSFDDIFLDQDSGNVFLNRLLSSNYADVINTSDGNVYFTNFNGNKVFGVTTWVGNEFITYPTGPEDKSHQVNRVDANNEIMAAIGDFKVDDNNGNNFLTIYNLKDKSSKFYDKNNSDLPGFNYETQGIFTQLVGTLINDVSIDKFSNIWLLTSDKTLIKFNETKSEVIELKLSNSKVYLTTLEYDSYSNELIFRSNSNIGEYYWYDIENNKTTQLELSTSGIKGNLIKLKKIINDNIWASDDLGYLYQYRGKGLFEIIDLKIHNKINLGFPILDFCLDINQNLHLATEIGLLSNNNLLSSVEIDEITNQTTNEIVNIYPNPSNDFIKLSINYKNSYNELVRVEIIDILGKTIKTINNYGNNTPIDIKQLNNGTYYLKISSKNNEEIKQLIINK